MINMDEAMERYDSLSEEEQEIVSVGLSHKIGSFAMCEGQNNLLEGHFQIQAYDRLLLTPKEKESLDLFIAACRSEIPPLHLTQLLRIALILSEASDRAIIQTMEQYQRLN